MRRIRLSRAQRTVALTMASIMVAIGVTQAAGPSIAAAAAGPTVPLTNVPSVPAGKQSMAPRPVDEATSRQLHGDQPAAGSAKEGGSTSSATPLAPSATWDVAAQTGDFTWTYPLRVPPAPGGLEPNLALSYASSAVDGRTSATNNQASWVGDGWSLDPGFVERSYGGCADDKEGSTKGQNTPDLCWRSDNATAAYGGGGGTLILGKDGWRNKRDDGARIERLNGASNDDADGEYWRITGTDGTQYFFGSRPDSKATWTVPVYGDDTDEPCHQATFDKSSCKQAWRWNLDKVIDPHGNVMLYNYETETNKYGQNLKDPGVEYIRGGWLKNIEYGLHTSASTQPTGRVDFATAYRCVPGSTCTLDKPENFPDVALEDRCDAATCKDKYWPTFWSTQRLSTITTSVWRGSSWGEVDRWTLDQQFPDPGDGGKAALWLKSIKHTGLAGATPVDLPLVTFEGAKLANRVYQADDLAPIIRYRVTGIVSETGGVTSINYAAPDCLAPPTNPETNTLRCFPVRWTKKNHAERLDYFNKYVVASVTESDRISSNPMQLTSYEYLDGAAWHYDDSEFVPADKKTWNDFRGFGRVKIRKGTADDPSGPQVVTEQRFYRGMNGDHLPSSTRTVDVKDSENGAHHDDDWLQGFLLETISYLGDTDQVVSKTINEPAWQGPTAVRGDFKAYIVDSAASRTMTALDNDRGWLTTRSATKYDELGVPIEVSDLGDVTKADDDKCSRTTYVRNRDLWLMDLPSREETVSVSCDKTPVFPDNAVSDVYTSYDGHARGAEPTVGNATKVERLEDRPATGPASYSSTTTEYDVHGRATASSDALGRVTRTAYTPATGGPATKKVITEPAGFATTTTLDPAWGLGVVTVNANLRKTETSVDALGRVTAVWPANRPRSNFPASQTYSYRYRNDAPTVVTETTLGPNGRFVSTNQLYDGLLRLRQTQAPAVGGGRLITDTRYDSQGRVWKQTQPYYNDGAVDTDLWTSSDADVPGLSVTEYDGAGRTVARIYQAGVQEKWRTTTKYEGDGVTVTPPQGDTPTTSIFDARGQTVEFRQHKTANTYDTTKYGYTRTGKLSTVQDSAGNTWRYKYDLQGRQVWTDDPDKGASTMVYDAAGQLTQLTDAKGNKLFTGYDPLGRRLTVRSGSADGPLLSKWTYDTALYGKGQLATATRYENGQAYSVAVDGYTALDQPSTTTITIPDAEGLLAGSYATTSKYNADGSLASSTYPAAGDLQEETVNHTYDDFGRPLRTYGGTGGSTVEYAQNTEYTRYGELQRMQLGEGTKRAWLSNYYDDSSRRLNRTIVDAEVTQPMQADVKYERDPAGNIISISDTAMDKPADVQCFRYDYLKRLTEAWTPGSDCSAAPAVNSLTGPAPYWQSFSYDAIGNRKTKTSHAAAGDTTQTYAYPAAGGDRPHGLDAVTTAGPGVNRVDDYGYDVAGNTVSRKVAGTGQTLEWDVEGHLAKATQAGKSSTFLYDPDGNRLIRRDPGARTLYLNGEELRLDETTGQLRATRYYSHAGESIGVRTAAGLTWTASDHQGTGMIAIGADSQAVTRRWQTPFGESRGTAVDLPGSKGFVGGTEDADLTHLGAREYEASTGRFITVDPVMDLSDPQQMQGYAYSNNSPVTYSDPSGRTYCICGHAGPPPPPPTPATVIEIPDIQQKPKAQKPTVTNQKLQNHLNHIYAEVTDKNWIGSGKSADALRNELLTGRATHGIYHDVSVAQDFAGLVDLIDEDDLARGKGSSVLSGAERNIAIEEAKELWGALNQQDSRGVVTRNTNSQPGRKDQFEQPLKKASEKMAYTKVTDAQYYKPENPVGRNPVYKNKGATTRGFLRGMGFLSVVPIAIDIIKGPTPGASPKQQMIEGFCVFDVLSMCDQLLHPQVGGIA